MVKFSENCKTIKIRGKDAAEGGERERERERERPF